MTMLGASTFLAAALLATVTRGPAAVAAADDLLVTRVHAEGAQVYECKPDPAGALTWQFREPIATLLQNGRTVGRHYAGPSWELDDGSVVMAKVTARAPGATALDIPILWLEVLSRRGQGRLLEAATVERVNTKGGVAAGSCPKAGDLLSVPYSADYTFLKPSK
jgi:FtsP/CotA-like multicopper oxidase with cupredoxin domain